MYGAFYSPMVMPQSLEVIYRDPYHHHHHRQVIQFEDIKTFDHVSPPSPVLSNSVLCLSVSRYLCRLVWHTCFSAVLLFAFFELYPQVFPVVGLHDKHALFLWTYESESRDTSQSLRTEIGTLELKRCRNMYSTASWPRSWTSLARLNIQWFVKNSGGSV